MNKIGEKFIEGKIVSLDKELMENLEKPDLIVMDGGKGQKMLNKRNKA